MHPEILREIGSQRGSELRARAHQVKLARMAGKALRAARRSRHAAREAGTPIVQAIPDYVDGSFRATAQDQAAGKQRRIPVGRRAA